MAGRRGPQLLLIVSCLLAAWFFTDRVAGLWQHPFRSAVMGWDNTFYYLWLRAPMLRGDFDFRRDLQETRTMSPSDKARALALAPTATGHLPDKYPIGWAMSSLPWYFLGALLTHTLNLFWAHLALDGYGTYYQFCLMLGQLIYGVVGLWIAWWLVRRLIPGSAADYGVLLVWLGSFLFYYQTSNLSMTHSLNFFAQMGAYGCTWKIGERPERRRYWLGLGLFAALAVLARYQSVVLLIYPFFQVVRVSLRQKKHLNLCLSGAIFGAGLIPQLLAWKAVYGNYLVYSYQNEGFDWLHPHLLEVLFSPWHGLFYWHPLLLLAGSGFLAWAWSARSGVAVCWTISALLLTVVNAAWHCWWFGSAFGLRAFDGVIFFGMLGLAYLLHRSQVHPWIRRALLGAALICVIWNIQLAWLARKDWLNLEDPVNHHRMWQTVEAFWRGGSVADWRRAP